MKHLYMDSDLVNRYLKCLDELSAEGHEDAKVALEFVRSSNAREWAHNIHNGTWGVGGLAGKLHARMIVKRIQQGVPK